MRRVGRADIVIAAVLAIVTAAAAIDRVWQIHPVVYRYTVGGVRTTDVWFDADIPKSVCLATNRHTEQNNTTSEHPLIAALLYVPAMALRLLLPIDGLRSAGAAIALWSGVWIAVFYGTLRAMGLGIVAGGAFALVAATSAAAIFWSPVPESFLIGAISMLLPMVLVLRGRRAWHRGLLPALASAAALSVTVTNWFTGLLATWLMTRPRRAVQISALAFSLVSAAWLVQSFWFPGATTFVSLERAVNESERMPQASPLEAARVLAIHSMVMPSIAHVTFPERPMWQLSVQQSAVGSAGPLGVAATVLWLGLLTAGLVQLARRPPSRPFRTVLVASLLVQYAIHVLLGRETFLFAMHFTPLLVMIAACAGLRERSRGIAGAAVALAAMLAVHNLTQFGVAAGHVDELARTIAASGATFDGRLDCAD